MTTHVFLMEAQGDTNAIRPENSEGIVDVKWFPKNEALKLIEYRDTQKLFKVALRKLNALPKEYEDEASHGTN